MAPMVKQVCLSNTKIGSKRMCLPYRQDIAIQPIEALRGTEKFLKVPLRGTFKNFSGFYDSAKRCTQEIVKGDRFLVIFFDSGREIVIACW